MTAPLETEQKQHQRTIAGMLLAGTTQGLLIEQMRSYLGRLVGFLRPESPLLTFALTHFAFAEIDRFPPDLLFAQTQCADCDHSGQVQRIHPSSRTVSVHVQRSEWRLTQDPSFVVDAANGMIEPKATDAALCTNVGFNSALRNGAFRI